MQNILREYYSVMYSSQSCFCRHLIFLVVQFKEKVVYVVEKVANWMFVIFFWQVPVSHKGSSMYSQADK